MHDWNVKITGHNLLRKDRVRKRGRVEVDVVVHYTKMSLPVLELLITWNHRIIRYLLY